MTFQTDAQVTNIATGATGANATSDGQVTAVHPQRFLSLSLTAGSDTATAVVQDANSASGAVIARLSAVANTTTSLNAPRDGVKVATNLFVTVTGTASNALIYWN
jgi:hypothetical protein|tara:strand:+ start:499 stop:813 length:315 start_codon:yes stop_codon:yes gene_type:complete